MIKKRFILAQGSMDGACFLYSMANATKALTGKETIDAQCWSDMLRGLTHVGDFLDQLVGTERRDTRPGRQIAMVEQMMRALAPDTGIVVSLVPYDELTGRRLAALIDAHSVLVVGTQEHWVCAVDIDFEARRLLVADSSELLESEKYAEKRGGQFGRIFNKKWSAAPQKRYASAFRISLAG